MRYRNLVSLSCLTMIQIAIFTSASMPMTHAFQDEEATDEVVKVLRVYHIADLVTPSIDIADPATQWPGTGLLAPAPGVTGGFSGFGGGMGGMGGGMGGGVGGGMFAVPSNPPQMGGTADSGGGGAMGMSAGGSFVPATIDQGGNLHSLIDQFLSGESNYDTSQLNVYNGLLVARQTESIHALIAEIIKVIRDGSSQTQVIHVEWAALTLDATAAQQVRQTNDQRVLQEWIDRQAIAYGSIAALNGHLSFSSSGEHRNLVIGVTPVVGTFQDGAGQAQSGVGYQPRLAKPILGWLAQVRPVIPTDPNQPGLIQVGISHVAKPAQATSIPVAGVSERGDLPAFQVTGTIKALPDTWTVLGGIADSANTPAEGTPKYVVLVRYGR